MAMAAKAFGATGWFFEVHPNPDEGKSDADNMLELDKLESLGYHVACQEGNCHAKNIGGLKAARYLSEPIDRVSGHRACEGDHGNSSLRKIQPFETDAKTSAGNRYSAPANRIHEL
jgi:hypothetical protein